MQLGQCKDANYKSQHNNPKKLIKLNTIIVGREINIFGITLS